MHVAKAIWGMMHLRKDMQPGDFTNYMKSLSENEANNFMGSVYAVGSQAFDTNPIAEGEIKELNKKIYEYDISIQSDYKFGKTWSIESFNKMYKKLGTEFKYFIFESEVADEGVRIVKENIGKVFEESDGAVVFKGEEAGLHTRVFINSQGLPTYEAKELGNTYKKESLVPGAVQSVVVTAHEIDEYFKVIKVVLEKIDKPIGDKLLHVSHGMLRLPEGKMSSRKGNVIPAEELIDMVSAKIAARLEEMKVNDEDKAKLLNDIAVGAIKFSILKSAPGKDMVFDFDKSLSFEGDSGPYLQYTHARLCALLDKAREAGIDIGSYVIESPERELEQVIIGYNQVLEKAYADLGPHHIVQYLLSLTRAFNSMYGRVQIIGEDKEKSAYYVMLSQAVKNILAHGLYTLGIVAPERM